MTLAPDAWMSAESCETELPTAPVKVQAGSSPVKALTLAQLGTHVFPERRPILSRGETVIFRDGHLGQVYAERGVGKTWLLETIALIVAAGSSSGALGFTAPRSCRVAYIDGEMGSQEIQERFARLQALLGVGSNAPLTIVAADWQETYLPRIDTTAGQMAIEPFVATADLVILDNRSCLFDPDGEKDAAAWQSAQDYLLSLRRRGKAVLVGHHSNRLGGARGHSKAEDPMNLLIKLARPEDYSADQGARFMVTFEKSRGAYGEAVAPFLARLTPTGWLMESATAQSKASISEKLIRHVRLAAEANERTASANAAIRGAGVNRNEGLAAWAALLKSGAVEKHPDGGFHAP